MRQDKHTLFSGVGYGSESIDTGGNQTTGAGDGQILSQAGFNQAMGITTTNPYPNSFFHSYLV